MATTYTYSIEGKDSEVVRAIVSMDLTMASTLNIVVSDYTAFPRAFATGSPVVVGVNAPRASSIANAIVTTTGISVYVRGLSDAALAASGALAVVACVEGRLA
ncbi:MAG: hypothetical protein M3Y08_01285 [Fibrobacterota bacterium]|nr:hypothetical protein [Fibrobacterota bacterium]